MILHNFVLKIHIERLKEEDVYELWLISTPKQYETIRRIV